MIHLVLYEPEIPPNTGNLIRLSANTGFPLHLIEPLGFKLSGKSLKRAGLDYRDRAHFTVYANLDQFIKQVQPLNIYAVSTKGNTRYTEVSYLENDALLFGPETRGLSELILKKYPSVTIPMHTQGRSLNLSNAVSIVAYEAWRQLGFKEVL